MRIVASLTSLSLDDELTRRNMSDGNTTSRLGGLIAGLKQRGWVEGVNYRFEIRSTFGGPDKLKSAVQELIGLKPDVILTGSTIETAAMLGATRTIPIVFATANDPVGNGFVESLARPGGNVTGFTSSTAEMGGKWLQLIKEAVPDIARVGVLYNPATTPRAGRFFLDSVEQEAAAAPPIIAQPLFPFLPRPPSASIPAAPIIPPPPSVQPPPPSQPPSIVPDANSKSDTLLGIDKEQITKYAPYAIGGVLLLLILKRSSK